MRNVILGLFLSAALASAESLVTICLATDPNRIIVDRAEMLANRMFAGTGVVLKFHEPPVCPPSAQDPVFVRLETRTPRTSFPGALGVALPLEGSHAWVFYDRVLQGSVDDQHLAALLAHVLAHEIAHVLEGTIRHSDDGILKAYWSPADCGRMAHFPLMFAPEDAMLIRQGLAERRSRLAANASSALSLLRLP